MSVRQVKTMFLVKWWVVLAIAVGTTLVISITSNYYNESFRADNVKKAFLQQLYPYWSTYLLDTVYKRWKILFYSDTIIVLTTYQNSQTAYILSWTEPLSVSIDTIQCNKIKFTSFQLVVKNRNSWYALKSYDSLLLYVEPQTCKIETLLRRGVIFTPNYHWMLDSSRILSSIAYYVNNPSVYNKPFAIIDLQEMSDVNVKGIIDEHTKTVFGGASLRVSSFYPQRKRNMGLFIIPELYYLYVVDLKLDTTIKIHIHSLFVDSNEILYKNDPRTFDFDFLRKYVLYKSELQGVYKVNNHIILQVEHQQKFRDTATMLSIPNIISYDFKVVSAIYLDSNFNYYKEVVFISSLDSIWFVKYVPMRYGLLSFYSVHLTKNGDVLIDFSLKALRTDNEILMDISTYKRIEKLLIKFIKSLGKKYGKISLTKHISKLVEKDFGGCVLWLPRNCNLNYLDTTRVKGLGSCDNIKIFTGDVGLPPIIWCNSKAQTLQTPEGSTLSDKYLNIWLLVFDNGILKDSFKIESPTELYRLLKERCNI